MLRALGASLAVAALAGCNAANETANSVARAGAKKAVNQVLFTQFSAVDSTNVVPFTDCVIDNANGYEINRLAQNAIGGITSQTVGIVTTVLKRPETGACIAGTGLARALAS
ncbi:MAG: succinate dehydrogenase [Rhodobacteraceae bacterium]|nr:succinate dehydrogenase [Paracoccaceae bacterium]